MYRFFIAVLVVFLSSNGLSQPQLNGYIGLSSLPKDSDSICTIIPYLGLSENAGLYKDHIAYDFTLYDQAGNPVTLSNVLKQKKPVLLISGSYTCPIFRSQVPVINQIARQYRDALNIYIIYTFEAHPAEGEKPYGENTIADNMNQQQNILFPQPKTYGERKNIAGKMLREMEVDAPIIFDGPCNEWSMQFGPAANNAYLIDTNGIIVTKDPWFNQSAYTITKEIEIFLNGLTGNIPNPDSGIFSFYAPNKFSGSGINGDTIEIGGSFMNASNADAIVNIVRIHTNLQSDWQTSLCSNICFSPTVDSISVRVPSQSSQVFKVYFYTGKNVGHGDVTLRMSNANIPFNTETSIFKATTTTHKLTAPAIICAGAASIQLFPNPASNILKITSPLPYSQLQILDELGRTVLEDIRSDSYDLSSLSPGLYYVQAFSIDHKLIGSERFIKE